MINKDLGLEKILKEYEYVGLSVLVADKDEIKYHVISGYQDLEEKTPLEYDTIFVP